MSNINIEKTKPQLDFTLQNLLPLWAGVIGWKAPKKAAETVLRIAAEDEKRLARITDLGQNGIKRAQREQQQRIIEAAERGEPLPLAMKDTPGLLQAIEEQTDTLKTDRAQKNALAWPSVVEIWQSFYDAASPWLDKQDDAEKELASRLGLQYKPSPTLATLRHVLEAVAQCANQPKDAPKMHGSPLQFCCLIQK